MIQAKRGLRRSELIVVEGFTDENYIQAVRYWEKSAHVRGVVNAKGGGKIIAALERTNLEAYTRIWIVVDAENHPHGTCMDVVGWAGRAGGGERLNLIVTAPRIEAWLLAHFETPTGTGPQTEERLTELVGYAKPHLPPGLALDGWRDAARRLVVLPPDAVPDLGRGGNCVLCQAASAMPWLVAELRGESWP